MARSTRTKKATRNEGAGPSGEAKPEALAGGTPDRRTARPRAATVSIPETGITFVPGGLHRSLGMDSSEAIPPAKLAAAEQGDFGPKAERQAALARTLEALAGRTPGIVTRAK